jgi:hypothetical protein
LDGSDVAADVQLQQFVLDWCRCRGGSGVASFWDRNRSLDVLFREMARRFSAPCVVETGTIRSEEDWGGAGFFTYLAGVYLYHRGGALHSVDIDQKHCDFAQTWTRVFGKSVRVVRQDSVEFLRRFEAPIDVLYLDSLDTTAAGHAEHALREVQAALPRLHQQSLVVLDDTPWQNGAWIGKGARAAPHLLKLGWSVLYAGYQVVLTPGT